MYDPGSRDPLLLTQLRHPTLVKFAELLPPGGIWGIPETISIFFIIFVGRMRIYSIGKEFITEII